MSYLDNPSLSVPSARDTPTRPSHSVAYQHTPVISRGPTTKPPRNKLKGDGHLLLLFGEHQPGFLTSAADRPGAKRHTAGRATKGFLFARPAEESDPGEHLIHFYLRAINLFKHQNHFASQERERRLSFLLQSTRGSVSVCVWRRGQRPHCPCSCLSHLTQNQNIIISEIIVISVGHGKGSTVIRPFIKLWQMDDFFIRTIKFYILYGQCAFGLGQKPSSVQLWFTVELFYINAVSRF